MPTPRATAYKAPPIMYHHLRPGNTVGLPTPNLQNSASGGSSSQTNSLGQPNQIAASLTNQDVAFNNLMDLMEQRQRDSEQRHRDQMRDSEQRHREQMTLMTQRIDQLTAMFT